MILTDSLSLCCNGRYGPCRWWSKRRFISHTRGCYKKHICMPKYYLGG